MLTATTLIACANNNKKTSLAEVDSFFQLLHEYEQNKKDKDKFTILSMSPDSTYIFKINDKNLKVFNHNLDEIRTINLPFSYMRIHQTRFIREKELMFVVTKNKVDLINPIPTVTEEKSLYLVNLETSEVTSFEDAFPPIFSAERVSPDGESLYVKHFFNDGLAYGKIDLNTYTITTLDTFDFMELLNIYSGDFKVASVKLSERHFDVYSANGQLIHSDRIRKIEDAHVTSSPFKYFLSADNLYFLDETSGRFGTIRCFILIEDKLTDFEYVLEQPLKKIYGLTSNLFNIATYSDTIDFNYSENVTFQSDGTIKTFSEDSKYFNNTNRYTWYNSEDMEHVIYWTHKDNTNYIIYENTITDKEVIVHQEHSSCFNMSKEKFTIQTSDTVPLEFYGYLHKDNKLRPTIIMLHGGPYWRYNHSVTDDYAYILHQMGFNIIELNYHGSADLGPEYRDAANESLPLKAKESVKDLLDWLIINTPIDLDSVFLMGSSYGGYLSIFITSTIDFNFKYTVAIAPAPEDNLISMNDKEHLDVKNNPDKYSLETLMANNPKPIGVVYNYLDPQMVVKKNWDIIAGRHPQLVVIDEFSSGHIAPLKSYKKVVELLVQLADLDQEFGD